MEEKVRLNVSGCLEYTLVFVINGLLWWYFRSYLNFMFAVLWIILPFLSIVVFYKCKSYMHAKVLWNKPQIERGADIKVSFVVYSKGVWHCLPAKFQGHVQNVFTGELFSLRKCLFIYPKREVSLNYRVESTHCGMLEGIIDEFILFDYLKLIKVNCPDISNDYSMVYPNYAPVEYEKLYDLVDKFPKEESGKQLGNDYTPDIQVREYIPGDSLKNVHWKLTAKTDELMIRERLMNGKKKMNVLVEFSQDCFENDVKSDSLRWVLEQLLENEYPISLFTWGNGAEGLKEYPITENSDLERALYTVLGNPRVAGSKNLIEAFLLEQKGVSYILIQTGEKKGEFISA